MNKAEQRALEYAKSHAHLGWDYDQTYDAVKYGYLQAEKDVALTWEDMQLVWQLCDTLNNEQPNLCSSKDFFTEVLSRFNEQRKK